MTYEKIIQTVFDGENLLISDGMSRSRNSELVEARMICYSLGYEITGMASNRLGNPFNRDHATVLHGISKLKDLCIYDSRLKAKYENYRRIFTLPERKHILIHSYRVGRFAWMRNRPILNNLQTAI